MSDVFDPEVMTVDERFTRVEYSGAVLFAHRTIAGINRSLKLC